MFYYSVWVRSNHYHSYEPLTYGYEEQLPKGKIVRVELQNISVIGFVSGTTSKPKFKTKQIEQVYDLPPIPQHLLNLASWLKDYYPAPIGSVAQQFLPSHISTNVDDKLKQLKNSSKLPTLTEEQASAIKQMKDNGTYLLHGRTGTGKTRIYIEEAIKCLASNQSAIILSPEIGLSHQHFDNFSDVFGNQVITIHSKLTPKERLNAWLRCLTSEQPLVVIGPRSALFSPLKQLGLIVIDEVHDSAYKQEQLPHYQTVRVASALSKLTKSKLILGSATPSVNDYYLAKAKNRPIIKLTQLAKSSPVKSDIEIVDLKDRSNFPTSHILSSQLLEAVKSSLGRKEQSFIFLNRRGTSRLILCDHCGWEAVCPNCNLPLIYHGDVHELRCHTCGYSENSIPATCPKCDSDSILFTSVGTKAIVDEVKKLFVNAVIRRFDTDNVKADSIGQLYKSVLSGEVDILIGTQQLAKGFDFPRLSTVGIIQADTSLYLPDYTSEERSFQLLTQVLGRISRGHLDGKAIIQTYNPGSDILKAAINQDYKSFYDKEIASRKQFKFTPFYSLLKLSCRRSTSKSAETACNKLKTVLIKNSAIIVEGPAPSFHEKSQGKYQWQLIIKATNRNRLLEVIKMLPSGWSYDIDPTNLL